MVATPQAGASRDGAAMSRSWGRPALIVALALLGYLAVRPRMLCWGATREEAAEALPGDELTPKPRVQSTRAITIEATPERVWPWIVQMGIERGGFYTHDWFERLLFHARYVEGRHSATRIHPELQELKVGDLIPYGGGATRVCMRSSRTGTWLPARRLSCGACPASAHA